MAYKITNTKKGKLTSVAEDMKGPDGEYRYTSTLSLDLGVRQGLCGKCQTPPHTVIPRLTSDPANEDFSAVFLDSATECFSGCAR